MVNKDRLLKDAKRAMNGLQSMIKNLNDGLYNETNKAKTPEEKAAISNYIKDSGIHEHTDLANKKLAELTSILNKKNAS